MVFVDDNSSDDSLTILSSYDDKRIKTFQLDQNVGVSKARNIGIKNASGFYLTTLDSDDFFIDENKNVELIDQFHDVFSFQKKLDE